MKKYIVIIFLLLYSCQKDYIEDLSSAPMFFDKGTQEVVGDVSFDFALQESGIHYLLLVDINGRLLAREKFNGIEGVNTKKLFINLLDQEEVYLMLYNWNDNKIKEVLIKIAK